MYAVIRTGGKQYKVEKGQTLDIEKLEAEEGKTVNLDKVLLISDKTATKVGTPLVEGAYAVAKIVAHKRGDKILVFKIKLYSLVSSSIKRCEQKIVLKDFLKNKLEIQSLYEIAHPFQSRGKTFVLHIDPVFEFSYGSCFWTSRTKLSAALGFEFDAGDTHWYAQGSISGTVRAVRLSSDPSIQIKSRWADQLTRIF